MSKLIYADIRRLFKYKLFYFILLIAAVIGAASVLTTIIEEEETELIFSVSSNNLMIILMQMMPVISGGLSILMIGAEFSSGIIRNKFVIGHKRSTILLSWTVLYSITTLLTFLVLFGSYFITLLAAGVDFSSVELGNSLLTVFIIMLFVLKFQMFSLLMACIYPDAKTAVLCYILNIITSLPMILLTAKEDSQKILNALSKFLFSCYSMQEGANIMTKPDKPVLTIVCIITLGAVYLILANCYFNKKDVK